MRVAKPVQLNADDDRRLRILSNRKRVEARVQMRARIVLMAAEGISDKDIAEKLDSDRRVAARWRARFLAAGVDGLLQDTSRPGRPRTARESAKCKKWFASRSRRRPKGRLTSLTMSQNMLLFQ
ncbi:MAG: helix-turn-helix domain-containing protein [Burkholderiaceae bacterium]|nr:helix-turn-helix domain-containing protein [Burkholderiaceae bacterium]